MRIRTFVAAGAILLASLTLLADTPGGRAETRMVFDPVSNHIILYGGATATDAGTKVSYDLADTWQWLGDRWVRLATAHNAGERSGQAMVYDSNRNRIVMFGGRRTDTSKNVQSVLADTWIFQNGDWSQVATPNTPPGRTVTGAAFDPVRDRIVMFGGNTISTDGKNTVTSLHDTWEFDGTTWTQRGPADGPKLTKPSVTYDPATNQVILLGLDETSSTKSATAMFLYDGNNGTWNQIKPDGLPPCVNESHVAFDGETNNVILVGGVCADSNTAEDTYSWDGTKWTKLDVKTAQDRAFGGGIAYDPTTQTLVQYGGTVAFGGSRIGTFGFHAGDWRQFSDTYSPSPRGMAIVFTYPGNDGVYLYGGLDENGITEDLWNYSNGVWTNLTGTTTPTACDAPVGAYDSDRKVYEIICSAGNVWEFDGTNWTNKKDSKDKPPLRRLSSVTYDQTLKKTVLFGGYDESDFINQTWLWDGTNWSRVKKNPPQLRAQSVMWWDPTLKKTVIYGGIGREDANSRVERFADMWSFDGSGWTDMKVDPAKTPGMRYSASSAIDPRTGHLIVFGGLVYTKDATTQVEKQFYVNDTWEWDGAKWTKVTTTAAPDIRENSGFVYDPAAGRMMLFGGYGGHYFGDVWQFNTTNDAWQPLFLASTGVGGRRRTAPIVPVPSGGNVVRIDQQ